MSRASYVLCQTMGLKLRNNLAQFSMVPGSVKKKKQSVAALLIPSMIIPTSECEQYSRAGCVI